jgi:hypothetical protein
MSTLLESAERGNFLGRKSSVKINSLALANIDFLPLWLWLSLSLSLSLSILNSQRWPHMCPSRLNWPCREFLLFWQNIFYDRICQTYVLDRYIYRVGKWIKTVQDYWVSGLNITVEHARIAIYPVARNSVSYFHLNKTLHISFSNYMFLPLVFLLIGRCMPLLPLKPAAIASHG